MIRPILYCDWKYLYFLPVNLPRQLPQQNPTVTVALTAFPEIGQFLLTVSPSLLSAVTFLRNALAFLPPASSALVALPAQFLQHTPMFAVLSALIALPDIGQFLLAAPAKRRPAMPIVEINVMRIFFIFLFDWYYLEIWEPWVLASQLLYSSIL